MDGPVGGGRRRRCGAAPRLCRRRPGRSSKPHPAWRHRLSGRAGPGARHDLEPPPRGQAGHALGGRTAHPPSARAPTRPRRAAVMRRLPRAASLPAAMPPAPAPP
ncbi:hypothetical protein B6E66_24085 [Streptomyces maremycinicus]|nr:hypothetical protein B6E66_24085 [Streptomyces sp. B9173]